jgi:CBS domain-containing protein
VSGGIRTECPEVEWLQNFALLGPYDYLDVFRAPDLEAASKVSALVRTFGHAQTEIWGAIEWKRFKHIVAKLPARAGQRPEWTPTMLVKDIMTPHAEHVAPDTSVLFAARTMRQHSIGCLPICEGGKLVGLVTDRDIVCRGVALTDDLMELKVRDVMTESAMCVFDDQNLEDAVRLMGDEAIYHLPVLDRRNNVVGMLALSDLALKGSPEFLGVLNALVARDATRGEPREPAKV